MKLDITDQPLAQDDNYIIDNLWAHNSAFEPFDNHPLQATLRDDNDTTIGRLFARTWWGALEIQYSWVHQAHRKSGMGTRLMLAAEKEAVNRGCHMAYVDTFNFQSQGFYYRFGYYKEYGELPGYVDKYTRYYL